MSLDEFYRMLEQLLAGDFTGKLIKRGFNNNLLKLSANKLLDHMIGFIQVVNQPSIYLESLMLYWKSLI